MPKTLTELMDKYRKNVATYDTTECTEDFEYQDEWDNFMYDIKKLIRRMRTKRFFAYGLSLTWRNIAGYTAFETESAQTLINKLAPNSDYTMRIYTTKDKNIFEVVISHHDKPTGETMYLMSQEMCKRRKIMEQHFS